MSRDITVIHGTDQDAPPRFADIRNMSVERAPSNIPLRIRAKVPPCLHSMLYPR